MTAEQLATKADKVNAEGNKVVYAPDGKIVPHQKVDDTTDKPISPKGVASLHGVSKLTTTTSDDIDFTNLITAYDIQPGWLNAGNPAAHNSYEYNAEFISVVPGKKYFITTQSGLSQTIQYHDINKVYIKYGKPENGQITIPENIHYIRYTDLKGLAATTSMYAVPTTHTTETDYGVYVKTSDIIGATSVATNTGNILKGFVVESGIVRETGKADFPAGSGWMTTRELIPIEGGKTYSVSPELINGSTPSLVEYDLNQRVVMSTASAITTHTTRLNTRFIRFNTRKTDLTSYSISQIGNEGYYLPNLYVPRSNLIDITIPSSKQYVAFGDSQTVVGYGATKTYVDLLTAEFGLETFNFAVSGARLTLSLFNQMQNIPEGFQGVGTILMGTNDFSGGFQIGNVATILAKPSAELVNGVSMAESLRYSLEYFINKYKTSRILVISIIRRPSINNEAGLDQYRLAQKQVCEFLSVPYIEIYSRCGIAEITKATYIPDGVHPNDLGHIQMYREIKPEFQKYL